MAISLAGFFLPTFDPATEARIEAAIRPSDVYPFTFPNWPGKGRSHLPWPGREMLPPIELHKLHWPVGASRWATFHAIVDDATLQALGPALRSGTTTQPSPLPLILSDGNTPAVFTKPVSGPAGVPVPATAHTIQAQMYALPPRPVFQTSASLWILTLVDIRYWWWYVATDVGLWLDNANTWTKLLASLSTALATIGTGITFEAAPAAAYLTPPISLVSHYEWLPPLIDAIAYSTGTRLVMPLSGLGAVLRNPVAAKKVNDAQITATGVGANNVGVRGGGVFRFSPTVAQNDLQALLPGSVAVSFPKQNFGLNQQTPYATTVTLASLNLSELPNIRGNAQTEVIHSSACYRLAETGDTGNLAEITALANQIATDYYRWRLPRLDTRLDGIIAWAPDGFSEIDWYHRAGNVSTVIRRPPWNAEPLDLCHAGTVGQDGTPHGDSIPGGGGPSTNSNRHGGTGPILLVPPVAFSSAMATLGRRLVQEGVVDVTDTANDLAIPDCTHLKMRPGGTPYLTGIANPASDMELYIVNVTGPAGGVPITLAHLNGAIFPPGGSQPQNQFICPNDIDFTLEPDAGAVVVYDQNRQAWKVIASTSMGDTIGAGLTLSNITQTGANILGAVVPLAWTLPGIPGALPAPGCIQGEDAGFNIVDPPPQTLLQLPGLPNRFYTCSLTLVFFLYTTQTYDIDVQIFVNGEVPFEQDYVVPVPKTMGQQFTLTLTGAAKFIPNTQIQAQIDLSKNSPTSGDAIDLGYGWLSIYTVKP